MAGKAFRGLFEHTIDDKGRLNFPSHFRNALRQHEEDGLVILPWGDEHLRVYPIEEWEAIETKIMSDDEEPSEEAVANIRKLLSRCVESALDKQGRILIPPQTRARVGLNKDVVLTGMINRVEIWDREKWSSKYPDDKEDTENLNKVFRQKRIF